MTISRVLACAVVLASFFRADLTAQEVSITTPPPPPVVGPILRPFHFERRTVTPAKLNNSPRLEALVRGGNLYLSVQDVIALVLENNLDIAIQRYGPLLAKEVHRRTEGGGYLRQVDTAILPGPTSVSTLGVSFNASGVSAGAGIASGGGVVSQLPPLPPVLDPSLYLSAQYGHLTTPLTNTLLNQTTALTNDFRQYVAQYSQQWVTGTSAQLTYVSYRSLLNSPTPLLNPATNGFVDLQINQTLLQGFGIAVNNRDIRVARNNAKVSDLQLKRQVITTISAVLNLYWDLVSFNEDVHIKQQAYETFIGQIEIPALNRAGVHPVGAFKLMARDNPTLKLEADSTDLYVVLPHKSAESLITLEDRLAADEAYQKEGAKLLITPQKDPAFQRYESSLLSAFDMFPQVEVPTTSPERLIQLRA